MPVIFVTALSEVSDESAGFEAGAVDYITKPSVPPSSGPGFAPIFPGARRRVAKPVCKSFQCLGWAAEYRDNETGLHVIRMSHYSRISPLAAGFRHRPCR